MGCELPTLMNSRFSAAHLAARNRLAEKRRSGRQPWSLIEVSALRGHLSEYGYIVPQGITHANAVIAYVEDPNTSLPEVRGERWRCWSAPTPPSKSRSRC